MTPTREETLQAELEALKASLSEVVRKARDEVLEDAEKVDRASAVLDILRQTQGFVDGEAERRVMQARDYLRSVMGAK